MSRIAHIPTADVAASALLAIEAAERAPRGSARRARFAAHAARFRAEVAERFALAPEALDRDALRRVKAGEVEFLLPPLDLVQD